MTVQCPPRENSERAQEIAAICRKAGLDSVEIAFSPTLYRIVARKHISTNSYWNDVYTSENIWAIYLRKDSIIAFAYSSSQRNGIEQSAGYYRDDLDTNERWYWNVREHLATECRANIVFALQEHQSDFVDYHYRKELDSVMSMRPVLSRIIEHTAVDTTLAVFQTTQESDSRVSFGSTFENPSIWELDNTILTSLHLLETPKPFDRIRLFKYAVSGYVLETREQGVESSVKRYLIDENTGKELLYAIDWQARAFGSNRSLLSEQSISRYEKWTQAELLTDAYGSVALIGTLLPESLSAPWDRSSSTRLAVPVLHILGGAAVTLAGMLQPSFTRSAGLVLMDGATWALPQGMALYGLFENESNPNVFAMYGVGMAASLVRTALATRLPERLGLNYAQTLTIFGAGASGTLLGAVLPIAFAALPFSASKPPDYPGMVTGTPSTPPSHVPLRLISASTLLGAAVGYASGYLMATNQERPMTGGNGFVFDAVSKIGLTLPLTLSILSPTTDELLTQQLRTGSVISLLGQIAGYGVGSLLLEKHDFSYQQETRIRLSAAYGGLTGMLIGVLLPRTSGTSATPQAFFGSTILGWGAGMMVGLLGELSQARKNYLELHPLGQTSPRMSVRTTSEQEQPSWLEDISSRTIIEFSPLGALGFVAPAALPFGVGAPLLSVQHRFK
ncbi:MAG: hypothetical protein EAZ92_12245 [Candidatus Kapaibacterium sp.]|nr:MAG: hypothetical protein EAZ92_12245 [Candidatus Kapabacteria bacterium]